MQTNVLAMGLFADGGVLASKPYAASANYINKMSIIVGGANSGALCSRAKMPAPSISATGIS